MNPKTQISTAYQQAYQRLNARQKEAVDHIYGPLMVIAGPGTGKTQLLAVRIGRILETTDFGPENILCLTFTNAGVDAMRKRLESFIGKDARKIGIYTFHAFCNEVIQDHPEYFNMVEWQPISELEKYEWMEEIISRLASDHPLYRGKGDQFVDVDSLISLNRIMKQEGWTKDMVQKEIDDYLEEIKSGKVDEFVYKRDTRNGKKGDLKWDKIGELEERFTRTKAALDVIEQYNKLLKEKKRYDYEDMINWVIDLFQNHQGLLSDYWERYQFILVDEYQDTNGAQNELLKLLTDYDQPNVMVVGDDDQAIYRFQGASIGNMKSFADRFSGSGLKVVVLEENYRSTQDILDVANQLIANNQNRLVQYLQERFQLSKQLFAHV
ncbi:ATP-dependent helicase [Thermoflavifilum thermophilum]|uniref:DNA 3'-5' helicase II n=1 Tax=Thermoflavifilum thermophilum TaxID=1393122 RepID=A0A1I7N9F0_9BACT|nr:ATP-dependent helicase [Thermoflavifilum thermophilum]SFV31287.1 UvrD/REP helicase N-terminal domain-containing protein [Thermoflavifilum thermophilum]